MLFLCCLYRFDVRFNFHTKNRNLYFPFIQLYSNTLFQHFILTAWKKEKNIYEIGREFQTRIFYSHIVIHKTTPPNIYIHFFFFIFEADTNVWKGKKNILETKNLYLFFLLFSQSAYFDDDDYVVVALSTVLCSGCILV